MNWGVYGWFFNVWDWGLLFFCFWCFWWGIWLGWLWFLICILVLVIVVGGSSCWCVILLCVFCFVICGKLVMWCRWFVCLGWFGWGWVVVVGGCVCWFVCDRWCRRSCVWLCDRRRLFCLFCRFVFFVDDLVVGWLLCFWRYWWCRMLVFLGLICDCCC